MLKESLQSLFSGTHMSHDGRVIAKRPGADLSGNGDDEATVWPSSFRRFGPNGSQKSAFISKERSFPKIVSISGSSINVLSPFSFSIPFLSKFVVMLNKKYPADCQK
jgi:hypothetical protein